MRVGAALGMRLLVWLGGTHIVDDQPGGKGDTALAPGTSVPGGPMPVSDSSTPPCWDDWASLLDEASTPLH